MNIDALKTFQMLCIEFKMMLILQIRIPMVMNQKLLRKMVQPRLTRYFKD